MIMVVVVASVVVVVVVVAIVVVLVVVVLRISLKNERNVKKLKLSNYNPVYDMTVNSNNFISGSDIYDIKTDYFPVVFRSVEPLMS